MTRKKRTPKYPVYARLRWLRIKNNYSQEKVGKYIHYSRAAYNNFECGLAKLTAYPLISLAKLYGTSVDYLLGLTDVMEPYPEKKEEKWYLE